MSCVFHVPDSTWLATSMLCQADSLKVIGEACAKTTAQEGAAMSFCASK
jgi:hypothetical protein